MTFNLERILIKPIMLTTILQLPLAVKVSHVCVSNLIGFWAFTLEWESHSYLGLKDVDRTLQTIENLASGFRRSSCNRLGNRISAS